MKTEEETEKEIRAELKEMAIWYGGWDKLKEVIEQLEENEHEAYAERENSRLV